MAIITGQTKHGETLYLQDYHLEEGWAEWSFDKVMATKKASEELLPELPDLNHYGTNAPGLISLLSFSILKE